MNTTNRRRTKLRSNQSAIERWKPSPSILVLVAGLLLGLGFGMRGRIFDQSASIQEHYLLLASDLYAAGAPVTALRDRLVSVGYASPSVAVVGIADQLSTSSDKVTQQEGDQLHQFASALAAGPDQSTIAAVVSPVPSVSPEATSTVVPPFSISEVAPVAPTLIPTVSELDSITPTTVAEAAVAPPQLATAAPSAPVPAPAPAAASGKTGVVTTANRIPVYLRKDPTSKSTVVAVVPSGSKVDIRGVVTGEAVDPTESHWYKVGFNGKVGYIYSKYVLAGG